MTEYEQILNKFNKWYNQYKKNVYTPTLTIKEVAFLSWLAGRKNGINSFKKSFKKLFNNE